MSLSGLISVADGLIGSFYNLMAEMFVDIYAKVKEGNINAAKKIQEKINIIILYALGKKG